MQWVSTPATLPVAPVTIPQASLAFVAYNLTYWCIPVIWNMPNEQFDPLR